MPEIRNEYFPLKDETDASIHVGYEVYNALGFGFSEIVYKDALEYEFKKNDILFDREREYVVKYKDLILKHKFFADFIVFNSIILEVKAKEGIAHDDMARTINYLKCSGCKGGLVLNFGRSKLEIKRLVF